MFASVVVEYITQIIYPTNKNIKYSELRSKRVRHNSACDTVCRPGTCIGNVLPDALRLSAKEINNTIF